jgi:hypothetical protein
MLKEAVEMSTDEESDGVVICHPNGNTDGCDEAISGSRDDDSPEGQETSSIKDPDVEGDTQEDKCVNQDSLKLIDQEKSAPPKSPAKSATASSGSERPKRVIPQPFSLSTQRRSSGVNGGVTNPLANKDKSGDKSSISPASMTKKVWSLPSAHFSLNFGIAYIITSCFDSVVSYYPASVFFGLILTS